MPTKTVLGKKRVLFLQNMIPHYRKPVFNRLALHHDLTVLHSGPPAVCAGDGFEEIVVPVRRMGPFHLQLGMGGNLKGRDFDAVVAMFDIRWIQCILASRLRSRSRFLFWGHRYGRNAFANAARDVLMRLSHGVILYSDAEVERMAARGLDKRRIWIAENTIEVPNLEDTSGHPKNSLLFVGRAQRRKRVDLLIESFHSVLPRLPENTTIDIVGEGEENVALREIANRLGIGQRVVFHGKVQDNKILKTHFSRAYAYVSPGDVGLGVLHSMAYGVPVMTCREGKHGPEFSNLRDGVNAVVYRDPADLREALVRLCGEPGFARRLGRSAFEHYSENRTVDVMVDGFLRAIDPMGGEG